MNLDVNKIKKDILKLAKKIGVEEAAIEKAYKMYEKKLIKEGVSEENLEERTWISVQRSLKRKVLQSGNNLKEDPGFYIARGNAFDGSKKARNEAQEYVNQFGLDEAIKANYARKNVDPKSKAEYDLLYKDFDWRMGKPIPETDWQANGLGIIKIDGKVKFAEIRFKGEGAIGPIELFKLAPLPYFLRNGDKIDSCELTCSKLPTSYEEDYVDLNDYAEYIQAAHGDRILGDLSEIEEYYLTDPDGFNRWCIVEGNVININPIESRNSIAVEIDDLSLEFDENGNDIPHMTIFFSDTMPIDFTADALGVTFVVNPYMNKDGKITLSGMGYWVESLYRATNTDNDEDPDMEDPWG